MCLLTPVVINEIKRCGRVLQGGNHRVETMGWIPQAGYHGAGYHRVDTMGWIA